MASGRRGHAAGLARDRPAALEIEIERVLGDVAGLAPTAAAVLLVPPESAWLTHCTVAPASTPSPACTVSPRPFALASSQQLGGFCLTWRCCGQPPGSAFGLTLAFAAERRYVVQTALSPQLFSPEAWAGGFYELAIELVEQSDERILAALRALWASTRLDGCYLDPAVEPTGQPRVAIDASAIEEGHLRGVAMMDSDTMVACGSLVIREDPADQGSDWLVFYLPLGALHRAFPELGGSASEPQHAAIDAWLLTLARDVFISVPFDLALIGLEASGEVRASQIAALGVPAERAFGLILPSADGDLQYFPRTTSASL